MASAAPSGSEAPGELTCPICLDAFRCPCTLSCGHSFCLKCVEGVWDAAESFSCPQCRVTFPQRPKLNKSFTLANLVEQRSAAKKMATVVLCDFCNDGTTSASKTCLKCDTSYCATHVKPHQENQKFRRHILVAPGTNPEDRKCKTHRKRIKFYCRQDKSLVCTTCTIAGDHKRHNVAKLEDEHKTREGHLEEKRRKKTTITHDSTQDNMGLSVGTGRATAAPPSTPSQEDIASLKGTEGTVAKLLYGRSPTLDTNSAHKKLQISSDLRTMTLTGSSQCRPDHPHRFNSCPQALCRESFSSGHHYWEVDVEDARMWRVGVAYGTIPRKMSGGAPHLLGDSDTSWCLEKSDNLFSNKFSVFHGGVKTALSVRGAPSPSRIGLHLHWEGGLLAFYRADSMEVIHEKQVGDETRAVEEKKRKAEESIKQMEAARRDVQGSMTDEKASISVRFVSARAALDAEEKAALEQVEQKGRELLYQIKKKIAHYQREIRELQAVATRLQTRAQESDSFAFLQGHLEETRRAGRVTSAPPSARSQEDIASLQVLETNAVKLLYGCSPTLDTSSAHNQLQISSELRTIKWTGVSQGRLDHPHRFDGWSQALCCESFSSGHHYWEVDVGDARWCRVGVAYGTIPRKGGGAALQLGQNDASWCLEKRDDNFSVVHGGVKTALSVRGAPSPRRIGLHLHWEGGFLEFYRADSMEVIHEVRQRFSQPLYPAMWVGYCNEPLKIMDLSRAS
ncbi:E3 ubiquitin/ISG15 ligase TRIM25-like isoform X5 [Lampetra planeri]